MRKSTGIALSAVVLGAIAVRLAPLWSFLYWGSDTAEYFSILRNLVRTGHVSTTYYGWGVTYPYFPGVFFPQAGLVELGGLDVPTVLNLLVPVIGAFAVVPMFLVAVRIARDDRIGLFAAAFLAGAIPHAYTTTHVAPATLGGAHPNPPPFVVLLHPDGPGRDRHPGTRATVAGGRGIETAGRLRRRPDRRHVRVLVRLRHRVPRIDPPGRGHPALVAPLRRLRGGRRRAGWADRREGPARVAVPTRLPPARPFGRGVRDCLGDALRDRRRDRRLRGPGDLVPGAGHGPPVLRAPRGPHVLLRFGEEVPGPRTGGHPSERVVRRPVVVRGRRDPRGAAGPHSLPPRGVSHDPVRALRRCRVFPPPGSRRPPGLEAIRRARPLRRPPPGEWLRRDPTAFDPRRMAGRHDPRGPRTGVLGERPCERSGRLGPPRLLDGLRVRWDQRDVGPDANALLGPRVGPGGLRRDRIPFRQEEWNVRLDRPGHGGGRAAHPMGGRGADGPRRDREVRQRAVHQGVRQRVCAPLLDRLGLTPTTG